MVPRTRRLLISAGFSILLVAAWPGRSPAQTQPRRSGMISDDFTGTYRYHGRTTLALVPGDSLLFAVIDEAKYPLRPAGVDRFVNAPGDTIPFRRDAAGAVTGFVERGTFFERLSPTVDPAAAQLVRARPRGADANLCVPATARPGRRDRRGRPGLGGARRRDGARDRFRRGGRDLPRRARRAGVPEGPGYDVAARTRCARPPRA
jgi:hypothetical protein